MNADEKWLHVLARDARSDGSFVYAVRSTGIYCRPSCPSRRPKHEQVAFFPLPEAAERAGYQPAAVADRNKQPPTTLASRGCAVPVSTLTATPKER